MGAAPYLGGGFGHFYAYAPIKIEYAIDRFAMEVKRQLDVLDRRLAESEYIAGDDYTIADMAIWPWYGALVKGLLYDAGEFLSVHEYTHVIRWTDQIAERPAVQARPHGQPRLGRALEPAPRAPRRERLRQGQGGGVRRLSIWCCCTGGSELVADLTLRSAGASRTAAQRMRAARQPTAQEEEPPGTAAHARQCDPTALWTRRRCASRSEHQGRRPRSRASPRAPLRRPCRTACCRKCGRSIGPIRESSRSGSDRLRRKAKKTNRTSPRRTRTPSH